MYRTEINDISGKKIRKKDLGMIAKSYGYVYVAQVAMGASQAQYFCRRPRTPQNKSNAVSNVVVDTEVYSCYGCEHLNIKSNGVRLYHNL